MSRHSTLVIIPAFNESGNIQKTIQKLREQSLPLDWVVINDCSTDETRSQAVAAGSAVINLPVNLGIGGAVQTGFLYARKHGYRYAAQVDGDGQHDTRYLEKILAPILDGRADIVVGSRFMPEDAAGASLGSWKSSAVRRVGIRFFAWLISGLTGYQVTDPTSGFRAFGPAAIAAFAREYPQDFPEPESIVIAKRLKLNLLEVPVEMRKRGCGQSSIRYFKTLYYMIKVTFAILLDMLKPVKHLS